MKKSVVKRVVLCLAALVLLANGVFAALEAFCNVQFTSGLGLVLKEKSVLNVLLTLVIVLGQLALGAGCVWALLPSRRAVKGGFVMQKTENGAIGISVRAIEGLVRSCVDKHEVIAQADIAIAERRDGIVIKLEIEQAAGVNIPLSIGVLQKQIRQYVTACTGVDVQEVRVLVENNDSPVIGSPYAVQDAVPVSVAASVVEKAQEAPVTPVAPAAPAVPVEVPAAPAAAPAPVPAAAPVLPVAEEEMEDDRPLHQRLFGTEEQPAIVPAPPELTAEAAAESAGEVAEEAKAIIEEPDELYDDTEAATDEMTEAAIDEPDELYDDTVAETDEPEMIVKAEAEDETEA